ncbi:putative bifunctional diguanylate cyclase/phosphodiesterase [Sporolactobacillus kofuensis]|uniref:Bifunctional diguanylate cyclase/phosphodiesterase n=1 Tax=Sporolactobacillus kofuensis TaxID=269672 RepID=A0ABW1WJ92_9BACL|nr:EAL domain-containing protein [Sporolactobacillus kofuensis]MCO7176874.1 EAL domain-containing protein [Sporolactobacillus kofuensis]
MSEFMDQEKWLKEIKTQEVDLSINDEHTRQQIRILHLEQLDLQILNWVKPLMMRYREPIAEQMSQVVTELFRGQSTIIPQTVLEKLQIVYRGQVEVVFSGRIDQNFIISCKAKADFFYEQAFSLADQVACFYHFHKFLLESIKQVVGPWNYVESIEHSLGKILNLEHQVVMDRYQIKKAAIEAKKEEQMRFKAYHDALTELPNNLLADETIARLIDMRTQTKRTFSLLKININRLKIINEIFGRTSGNELLISLSERINGVLRNYNADLFRISSDEFMIVCEDCLNKRGLVYLAETLIQASENPFHIGGKEIYGTFSIGISEYPFDGETSVQIQASADAALREAKKRNRDSYFFYNNHLHQQLLEKVNTENELQTALYNHQFVLYYQPQVNAQSSKLTGVEALIRWMHPKKGVVPPSGFISVAEETGMIRDISWWVLKKACKQMKYWHDHGAPKVPISVNLSFNQFHDDMLVKKLWHILETSGLNPKYLELEITESTMADDLDRSMRVLSEIRSIGIGVSLDDFGTGYSSLSYLKSLPINQLKIDRSFVMDIAESSRDQAIVAAIVSMAEHLWIDVIVEGIETKEQLKAIESCRCQVIQGYYYSQPLAEDEFSIKYLA